MWFSNTFNNTSYNLETETLVDFDDSYITDKETELERKRNDALSFDIMGRVIREKDMLTMRNGREKSIISGRGMITEKRLIG